MNVKKVAATTAALSLTAAVAVGGTLAWLTAKTDTIENTFTIGNVGIKLQEKQGEDWKTAGAGFSGQQYTVTPGIDITKEAKVTVDDGSEKSIVYLKVVKQGDFDKYFDATVDTNNWAPLAGHENYYWAVAEENAELGILTDNKVDPNESTLVNGVQLNGVALSFQAAAIQYDGLTGEGDAAKAADGFSKLPDGFAQ
ncbi:hypothetical protein INF37_13315 [Pseudoflavonifractor sp. DSM 107456]|uniref:Camelysin metallo-endopeptidase n=1 Tax=Pseudoflavonifractor gallinarum TaxID=2779352 RepID=A0ABR9RE82_9FIRM|nr:SipW-dependent-type signal peptide-containing protein [Pseudoflavonifractor gallinarum]MBE5056966.1 hypothetical protein [Pseudoflavonifractor gallinarum]